MVTLNKIYTKTGDSGETSLVGGLRVAKHSLRPEAFGEVDELNSILGLVRTNLPVDNNLEIDKLLERIQNELFDLGADLATPEGSKYSDKALRISTLQVDRLENEIDFYNKDLNELKSFVLPGGSLLSSWLHFARTATRRAERKITKLASEEGINNNVITYINRLSDLLFVIARRCNNNGKADILWQPGLTR
ncbi:MAG: ATP:cob(I)alamin adenosyltransferase [SAR116 cluster bacterium]|nr:ATP:cob(I)alamin adenosyltransferase [SAR116 cluster bacterium]